MGVELLLRSALRFFYEKNTIETVPDISSREFGIGEFGQKISSRHLSFKSFAEMNSFLREKTPFYISYSAAHYELPAARPMEKKNLLGADLIYEFDADDIKTECKISHDSWVCPQCKSSDKGHIEECPQCGSGVKVDEWVCPECLGETKRQSLRLINTLETDFNLSGNISVNFSGSKGFHVHVRGEAVQGFSKAARLELLDYLTATNIDLKSLGFLFEKSAAFCPKRGSARGWAKRLLSGAAGVFDLNDAGKLAVSGGGINFAAAQKLLKEKQGIMDGMGRGFLKGLNGERNSKFWSALLTSVADSEKLSVDRQTSVDINKIIRVPGTIHGSTGLQAKPVSLDALKSFDPLKETVVLAEKEMNIAKVNSPRFYLNGQWFGPYSNDSLKLPEYAAFYLLARGSAEVAQ